MRRGILGLAAALLFGASGNVWATITLQLTDATSYASYGGTATLDGSLNLISNVELIGIYGFTQSGLTTGNPFYSICLSPNGVLDWSAHQYSKLTFAEANDGMNPAAWAYSETDYWGIQNANYLWRTFSAGILTDGADSALQQKAKGTALALAMYKALYDSEGYGELGGSRFSTSGWAAEVTPLYDDYLSALSGFDINNDIYNGYVLRAEPNTQDFLLIGTPVPEPTTIIAGALLLLPFGLSTFRFMRRSN